MRTESNRHHSEPDHILQIARISFEHGIDGFGVGSATPRISWRFSGHVKDWLQTSYDIRLERNSGIEDYHVDSHKSSLVPWPGPPLQSQESVSVHVKANGSHGFSSPWSQAQVEAALLLRSDWQARMISASCPTSPDQQQRPFYVVRDFEINHLDQPARLYATAFGIYELEINGQVVGTQVLKPGWTSYDHRLYYQTFDVSHLLRIGVNTIRGHVAEGWYSGRLGYLGGKSCLYGERNGLMAQLMLGDQIIIKTDKSWKWTLSPIHQAGLYDGEVLDATHIGKDSSERLPAVDLLDPPTASLIPDMAPIRRMEEVSAVELITTPSGKLVVDFGQNLVGWIRINRGPTALACGSKVVLSHAEVLEDGELSIRPLRIARCQDTIICDTNSVLDGWEPKFTFHGFRYAQIDGWPDVSLQDVTAIVVHTDMEQTGWFECSHPLINKLHTNVQWGMKGNFVGVPTDCPQRDERLGYTGDLQVFCETANFLYDTRSMLGGWMQDLAVEQAHNDGVPPIVVPDILKKIHPQTANPMAVWGDIAVLGPLRMFKAFGDSQMLLDQYPSMFAWVTEGIPRARDGLWGKSKKFSYSHQLGDWLSPEAPPDFPGDGRTDPMLVANAYLVHVTDQMAKAARLLNKEDDARRFEAEHAHLWQRFSATYVSPIGRTVSDSQTALCLALQFNLLTEDQRDVAEERLEELVLRNVFKVATGFAGTPIILDALAKNKLHLAYRMLQEKQCPSWLYCVSMGATTIWERWDSMRPDGSINPGEMTSFNHYALGAVATFMHGTIGGISPLEPGWKKILIAPRPGGTVTSAEVRHLSPYGLIRCSWTLDGSANFVVEVDVPPNSTARVDIEGTVIEIGSGHRRLVLTHHKDPRWPPKPIWRSMTVPLIDEIA